MKDDLTEALAKRRHPKKNGKKIGYFEELTFSVADWQAMRDLLDILTVRVSFLSLYMFSIIGILISCFPTTSQPYKYLTRDMEGDKPTGCMVLVKYVQLKASMEGRLKSMHQNDPLYPMVDIMIDKIIMYLNEALECETLILAAVFHPGLRVKFFSHSFGMGAVGNNQPEELLKMVFIKKRDKLDFQDEPVTNQSKTNSPIKDRFAIGNNTFPQFYNDVVASSDLNELDRYLQGIDPMVSPDANDPQYVLDWWKVSSSFVMIYIFNPLTHLFQISRQTLANTQSYRYWLGIIFQPLQHLLHPNDHFQLLVKFVQQIEGAFYLA